MNIDDLHSLQQLHQQLVDEELLRDCLQRDPAWSEAIAVGSETFIEKIKEQLMSRASHLNCLFIRDKFLLKEPETIYQVHLSSEKAQLRGDNCYYCYERKQRLGILQATELKEKFNLGYT